ncbi:hypothetical protein INS49_012488 [Diaporthe citri]|uniref:uncharacterized protein n=1 Tax=Diaporthe citri TaxID=83186 RepID=UPI001C81AD7B|nr:uncharacterized protein INS49_012488 [Diaporthe citri]KAG6358968.1 hypothetical protein INS49_012488 [Diaporthe citri]
MSDTDPIVWKDAKKRCGQVVSRRMWLWTYTPIGLFLVGGPVFFSVFGSSSLQFDHDFGDSIGNRIIQMSNSDYGFDCFNTSTATLLAYCLTTNLPQLAISTSCFTFSSLYSTIFQGKYWADFAVKAQQLRSDDIRNAIASVSFWHSEFEFNDVDVYMGSSVQAMIPGLVIAAVAAGIPVILSFRPLPLKSVIVGTDSAVIASYSPSNTPSDRQDEDFECRQNPGIQLDNLMRSRRDIGRLRWGVLDLGSERNQRPGVLGLGTEEEVIKVSPIAGHKYISVASASDGVNHFYRGQAA